MKKGQLQKGIFLCSPPCPRVIEGSSVSLWDADRSWCSSRHEMEKTPFCGDLSTRRCWQAKQRGRREEINQMGRKQPLWGCKGGSPAERGEGVRAGCAAGPARPQLTHHRRFAFAHPWHKEGWTRWPTEVPSNPYHSVILWFCDSDFSARKAPNFALSLLIHKKIETP